MPKPKKKQPIDTSTFSISTTEMAQKLGTSTYPILKVKANKKAFLKEGVHWIRNTDYYNGLQLLWSDAGFQFMKTYFETHRK